MKLIVRAPSATATTGTLEAGGQTYPCTLGRAGVGAAAEKREGDGKTPLGTYPLRYALYRADRVEKPETKLPTHILTPDTGWCEDPSHPDYNKQITLPHPSVHDRMTRDEHVYDVVVIIGYNDDPVVSGKGSAIFMHHARPGFTPTQGCVGLKPEDLRAVLKLCDAATLIEIKGPDPS